MFIGALIEIVRFVPLSIQGIGIREGGFATLFAFIGFDPETGFTIGLLGYTALSLTQLLIGLTGKAMFVTRQFKNYDS